jgi:hypothetical protein
MNRTLLACAAAVLAAGASTLAQEMRGYSFNSIEVRMPFEAKIVAGAPYSADITVEQTQTLADGNRIVHRTTGRVYRDGQGRVRREEENWEGRAGVSIVDPVAKVGYSLDPSTHMAWRTLTPEGAELKAKIENVARELEAKRRAERGEQTSSEVEARRKEEIDREKMEMKTAASEREDREKRDIDRNRKDEKLPSQAIEGVRADGHRVTTTIAAGVIGNDLPIVIVSEEWTSPELQVLLMTHHTDPRMGESSYKLTNIVRAEPDRSLFEVPPGYTVRDTGIRREAARK